MPSFAPKRILCPLDLSPASPAVLRWAAWFAHIYEARLKVLHAQPIEYPPYFLPSQQDELAARAEHHRAALKKLLQETARETLGSNFTADIAVVEDDPSAAILKEAETSHTELIVLGSHGRSGLARLRLGSVAEAVMQEARVPTLVVRGKRQELTPLSIRQVLCPVSFTEHARHCLETAAGIAADFGAQLAVEHATEREKPDMEETRKQLCQWIPGDVRRRCEVVETVAHGNAAEQILLAARQQAADLIVLAAQHRPILESTTLGTTTERVMRHADCPVLIVPSGTGAGA